MVSLTPRRWAQPAVIVPLALATMLVGGCAESVAADPSAGPPAGVGSPASSLEPGVRGAADPPVQRAREGRPAASERIRFRPEELILARGGRADVEVAETVGGELLVPTDVRSLGWWDGGAFAGDPFGTVVIAGHVDSKTQGLGFFARLLRARDGDVVTLRGDGHTLRYRIRAAETVTKNVLAEDNAIFDQAGDHRLVLITCTGAYSPDRGYDSNLVLYAEPLGLAR